MIPKLFEAAWGWASIEFGEARIPGRHVLVARCSPTRNCARLVSVLSALAGRSTSKPHQNFHALTGPRAQGEGRARSSDASGTGRWRYPPPGAAGGGRPSKTPNLDQYCINPDQRARDKNPVLGRDARSG